jgi:hypothetical protein
MGSPADAKSEGTCEETSNPGAATRRGNEQDWLFDIVNRDDGQRFAARAP